MEFNTKIAPYAKVQLHDTMVTVDTQPASTPNNKLACEKNLIKYKMYQVYLNEQDFSLRAYVTGIVSMLTVEDILQNGNEVLQYVVIHI